MTRDKRKNRSRSVFHSPGSSLLQYLMPRSTQGSHSTVSPGASARGGFGMGIPAGGGGGAAAALAHAPGLPPGGPSGGVAVPPGVAPPPSDGGVLNPDPGQHPLLPPGWIPPTTPPTTAAQPPAGLFPTLPTTPLITGSQFDGPRGQFPTRRYF